MAKFPTLRLCRSLLHFTRDVTLAIIISQVADIYHTPRKPARPSGEARRWRARRSMPIVSRTGFHYSIYPAAKEHNAYGAPESHDMMACGHGQARAKLTPACQ